MIRPKYICNNCTHKSVCKYAESMEKLILDIDTQSKKYDNTLPANLSFITCDYQKGLYEGGTR